MRQRPVVIAVLPRTQITPTSTVRALAVALAHLDPLYSCERERGLKNVAFYFGYELRKKDGTLLP